MEEWDGAKSRRFYGGRQHVQPIIRQNSDYVFVTETHQGIAAVYGRKHYPPKQSETQRSDRFCFKKADLPSIQSHKVRGLKKFDILPAGQKGIGGKLILHPPPVKEKEQKSSIKIIQPPGNKSEYRDFRKKIIVEDSRNGLPVLVAGDKPYGYPQYSIDFFKEPGLIPGSSNAEKKTNAKRGVGVSEFATLQSYSATIPQRKLWRERKAEERMIEEINIVKGLEEWEKNVALKSQLQLFKSLALFNNYINFPLAQINYIQNLLFLHKSDLFIRQISSKNCKNFLFIIYNQVLVLTNVYNFIKQIFILLKDMLDLQSFNNDFKNKKADK